MKVTVIEHLNCRLKEIGSDIYIHTYTLQAENGIIEQEEADVFLPKGYVIDLPDDEWSPNSEVFTIKCDKCGYVREKRSVRGCTITCPICNTQEVIPL
jgi:rubrerythrin